MKKLRYYLCVFIIALIAWLFFILNNTLGRIGLIDLEKGEPYVAKMHIELLYELWPLIGLGSLIVVTLIILIIDITIKKKNLLFTLGQKENEYRKQIQEMGEELYEERVHSHKEIVILKDEIHRLRQESQHYKKISEENSCFKKNKEEIEDELLTKLEPLWNAKEQQLKNAIGTIERLRRQKKKREE